MNDVSTKLADELFPENNNYEIDILDIPAEKRKLNTETYDFTVSTIDDYIISKHINIPRFQRGYVWNRAQASRLIESLIIQCPIPVVYLSQNNDETLSVIDGNQRLTSINLFLNDEFPLSMLGAYPDLNGFKFSELDPRFQRHIKNRTIRCIVILKDTHPQIKFDVFERLNTGSVNLNPQEIRHGIYSGSLINKIGELAKEKLFKKITSTTNDNRMKGDELVLRFFALHENWKNYEKPMTIFLNKYAEKNRNIDLNSLNHLSRIFEEVFNKCHAMYGDYTFKTFDESKSTLKSNTALFEAQMISMYTVNPTLEQIQKLDKTHIISELTKILKITDFYDSITKATTDKKVLLKRINDYIKFFNTIIK